MTNRNKKIKGYKGRKLKIKKLHKDAVLPSRSHPNDAGYDIVAIDNGTFKLIKIEDSDDFWRLLYIQYKTGLAIEPSEGYHIEFVARSSISKTDLILSNCIAIGDQGYRGEYMLRFKVPSFSHTTVQAENEREAELLFQSNSREIGIIKFDAGDRIAQLLIRKTKSLDICEVDELNDTERGKGRFGSTGK